MMKDDLKIITATGYGGTGSSAIGDLVREYSAVDCSELSKFEVTFLYRLNGLLDLYYHLIKNPIRNESNNAIYHYLELCKKIACDGRFMNYEKYFNYKFLKETLEFIESIGGNWYPEYINYDYERQGKVKKVLTKVLNKILHLTIIRSVGSDDCDKYIHLYKKRKFYLHTLDEAEFLDKAKGYLYNLFSEINSKEYLYVDQLVSTSMMDQCKLFFDNLKIIVVDRDPRDIFIEEKYRWKTNQNKVENVHIFCESYKWMRSMARMDVDNVLYIQFEDLVFNYEAAVKIIENYCGLESKWHVNKYKYFDPSVSKNNCRLWDVYDSEQDNIEIIKNELQEYIYEIE